MGISYLDLGVANSRTESKSEVPILYPR